MRIEALNARGEAMLPTIAPAILAEKDITLTQTTKRRLAFKIAEPGRAFTEEERSRVPSVFTVLRVITNLFKTDQDANLGLYGAFGYDLAFQFDPVEHVLTRQESQRDLVLFLPDEILVVDHYSAKAWHDRYDYAGAGFSTENLPREPAEVAVQAGRPHSTARRPRARRICQAGRARRRRASGAVTCSRWCRGRCSTSAAKACPRRSAGG